MYRSAARLAAFVVVVSLPPACTSSDPERVPEDDSDAAAAGHAAHGGSAAAGRAGADAGRAGNAGVGGRGGNAGRAGTGGGGSSVGGSSGSGGCDGGGPLCTATPEPAGVNCCKYCDFMMQTCASSFASRDACLTYCRTLSDNQLCCRWSYCVLPDADQHCNHAGTENTVCQEP
jgi:hypothetical protein